MGKHNQFEHLWTWRHFDPDGKLIYEFVDKKNILVDTGEKAIVDTFYRKNAATYFAADQFYIGLYKGSIAETTVLSTIPGEPSGNGYARTVVERSTVGFPTLEQDSGHWRVVSKDITFTASGGNIGPVNGAFLGTSLLDTGVLICAVAAPIEQTILAGSDVIVSLKIKQL